MLDLIVVLGRETLVVRDALQPPVPVLSPVGVTWTQDVIADTYGLQWYLLSVFLIVSETEITETTED